MSAGEHPVISNACGRGERPLIRRAWRATFSHKGRRERRRGDKHHDLKKLFAASLDARFLAEAASRRSISLFSSAMRSVRSSTDSSDKSWPISWLIFFRGRSSSSVAMRFSIMCAPERLPATTRLAKQTSGFPAFPKDKSWKSCLRK